MDGVQLPQGYSHFEEAVYFLPLSSQKFLVLILSNSEEWKAGSTLELRSGFFFKYGTPGMGIHHLNQGCFPRLFSILSFYIGKNILWILNEEVFEFATKFIFH